MGRTIMATILLAAALTGLATADREFSFDRHDSFDGGKITAIRIDMAGGEIELARSATNQIEVDFKNVIFAGNQQEAEDINGDCRFEAEATGDRLVVTVDLPRGLRKRGVLNRLITGNWDETINSYLRVKIPDGKEVEIKSSSADLEMSQLTANLDVWSSSTDVRMRDTAGRISLELSSGDVDISHHKGEVRIKGKSSDIDFKAIEGNVDLRTSSGDGSLNGVKGSVSIYSSSGDYRLFDVEGDLDVRTSSGDIYVSGVTGSIRAEATSGDITLKELSSREGEFEVEATSGDVALEIGDEFEGSVSLRTSSGSVYSGLSGEIKALSDSRMEGSVGNGSGRLRVSTTSGDIRINRY